MRETTRAGPAIVCLASLGCASAPPRLPWNVGWRVGETFEITRIQHVTLAFKRMPPESRLNLPGLDIETKVVFEGKIHAREGSQARATIHVTQARFQAQMEGGREGSEYTAGKGQTDLLTGAPEAVEPMLTREYAVTVDDAGNLVHWEDRLDALDLLHGKGGRKYGLLTSILTDVPVEEIRAGQEWTYEMTLSLERLFAVPVKIQCRAESSPVWAGGLVFKLRIEPTPAALEQWVLETTASGEGGIHIADGFRATEGRFRFAVISPSKEPIFTLDDQVRSQRR